MDGSGGGGAECTRQDGGYGDTVMEPRRRRSAESMMATRREARYGYGYGAAGGGLCTSATSCRYVLPCFVPATTS
eukprot:scaffold543_cov118-Isochrysis_galbana.AAC.2